MARTNNYVCDWCGQETETQGFEDPIEEGWLTLERFDIIKGEIVENDFCCIECLKAYA